MKPIITIFLASIFLLPILFVSEGLAQNNGDSANPKSLVIDFEKKRIEAFPEKLKKGDFYFLKIKNINMNLYNVNYEPKDSVELSKINYITFEAVPLKGFSNLISSFDFSKFEQQDEKGLKFDQKTLIVGFDEMIEDMDLSSIEDTLLAYKWYIKIANNQLTSIHKKTNELGKSIEQLSISYLDEDNQKRSIDLAAKYTTSYILEESEKIQHQLTFFENKIDELEKKYESFYKRHKFNIDKKDHKAITESIKGLLESQSEIYESIDPDKVNEWLTTITLLANNADGEYQSLPIQLKGDYTNFSITITSKKDEFGMPNYETEFRIPNFSNWFIGTGASLYRSTLSDKGYSIITSPKDSVTTNYLIDDRKLPSHEFGFSTTINFGYELKSIGFHVSVGPAISLSNPGKARFLTGVGVSFGKRQRFAINYSGIAGYVDRLATIHENPMQEKSVHPDLIPDKVTTSKFKWGGAISFGYVYKL